MVSFDRRLLMEIVGIILIAVILGFAVNSFHPKRVAITATRPPIKYAVDTVATIDLPVASIQIDNPAESQKNNPIDKPHVITTEQLRQLIAEGRSVLIDARIATEYKKAHIPQSINIPFERLADYLEVIHKLPRDKWLICFCEGPPCDLGELMAYDLINTGFTLVAVYGGGVNAWKKEGYPLE